MQEVTVQPRSAFKHHIYVEHPGKILFWNFTTKYKNIAFGLYHRKQVTTPIKVLELSASANTSPRLSKKKLQKLNGSTSSLDSLDRLSVSDLNAPSSKIHRKSTTTGGSGSNLSKKAVDVYLREPGFELVEINPIKHYESSKTTIKGSYTVPEPGTYVLVFDNTFSVSTSKKLFFFVSLRDESLTTQPDADKKEFEGWIYKKGNKALQGYARRWLKIDSNGTLQYMKSYGSNSRATVTLSDAAVRLNHDRLLFDLDDGRSLFHFKALTMEDFNTIAALMENFTQVDGTTLVDSEQTLKRSQSPTTDGPTIDNKKQTEALIDLLTTEVKKLNELNDSLKTKFAKSGSKDLVAAVGAISESAGAVQEASTNFKQNVSQFYNASELILDHLKLTETLLSESISDNNKIRTRYGLAPVNKNHFISLVSNRERSQSISVQSQAELFVDADSQITRDEVFYDAQELDDDFDSDVDEIVGHSNGIPRTFSVESNFDSDLEDDTLARKSFASNPSLVKRRSRLPVPTIGMENISIMGLLKSNVGKDLSTVAMPILLNEPLNLLQKLCEELEYCNLLDAAASASDPVDRILHVASFAVSAYGSTVSRSGRKPFNPLLGETFEYIREDKCFKFLAEKVSHQPPIMACHAESKNYTFSQDSQVKTKFWGKSMELNPIGTVHVNLKPHNEHYSWGKVTSCMRNIFSNSRYIEHYGSLVVKNQTSGYTCQLQFKESGYFSSSKNEVVGHVFGPGKEKICSLRGKWDESLSKYHESSPDMLQVLWRANPLPPHHAEVYGFSKFAVELNEITPEIAPYLPKTDTRNRPDQRMYEEGRVEEAEKEKLRLEQKQRDTRKVLESSGQKWRPKYFYFHDGKKEWLYGGSYWSKREKPGELDSSDPIGVDLFS